MPILKIGRKSFLLASLLSLVFSCSSPHTEEKIATWRRPYTSSSLVSKIDMPNHLKWLNKKIEDPQDSMGKKPWGENQIVDRYLHDTEHPDLNSAKLQTGIEAYTRWEKDQRYLKMKRYFKEK